MMILIHSISKCVGINPRNGSLQYFLVHSTSNVQTKQWCTKDKQAVCEATLCLIIDALKWLPWPSSQRKHACWHPNLHTKHSLLKQLSKLLILKPHPMRFHPTNMAQLAVNKQTRILLGANWQHQSSRVMNESQGMQAGGHEKNRKAFHNCLSSCA